MAIVLGGIGIALAFIAAGVIAVIRALPRFRNSMTQLQRSVTALPIQQGIRDAERLQISLSGLQALLDRMYRFRPGR